MKKQHVKLPLKQRAKLAIQNNIGLIVLIVLFVLFATGESIADYIADFILTLEK